MITRRFSIAGEPFREVVQNVGDFLVEGSHCPVSIQLLDGAVDGACEPRLCETRGL